MQQRFSIRKYHFGAASVLLGTALVLGSAANAQTVQADENGSENTKTVKADKLDDSAKDCGNAKYKILSQRRTYGSSICFKSSGSNSN